MTVSMGTISGNLCEQSRPDIVSANVQRYYSPTTAVSQAARGLISQVNGITQLLKLSEAALVDRFKHDLPDRPVHKVHILWRHRYPCRIYRVRHVPVCNEIRSKCPDEGVREVATEADAWNSMPREERDQCGQR